MALRPSEQLIPLARYSSGKNKCWNSMFWYKTHSIVFKLQESPFSTTLSPLTSGKANIPSPSSPTPPMDHDRQSTFIQSTKESDAANSNNNQQQQQPEALSYYQKEAQSSSPSGCIDEYLADHLDMEGTPSSLPSILQPNCVHNFSESGFSGHRHEKNDAIVGNARAKMMSGQTSEEPPFVENTTHVRPNERFSDSMELTSTKVSDLESDTFLGTFSGGEHGKSFFFQGSDQQERRHLQFGIAVANTRNESEDASRLGSPADCMNYEADVSYRGELRGNSSGQQIDNTLRAVNSLSPFNPSESIRTAQNSGNNALQACIPSDMGLHLNTSVRSGFGGSESTASKKLAGNISGGNQKGSQAVMTATSSASQFNNTMQPRCNSLQMTLFEQHAPPNEGRCTISKGKMESYRMSPQKNRKKGKYSTESSGCKRCNCKRSKCLKLYCECFAAGVYCLDTCSCENCYNKPDYDDLVLDARIAVLQRNPTAFQSKIVNHVTDYSPENMVEGRNWATPASARHKRGCNCKKSKCLKKYCECYQAGVGCSDGCRCEGCKNSHGKKSELMRRRTERWENPLASLETHSNSMKTGRDIQSSPTWENVVDVTHLTPSSNPHIGPVTSSTPLYKRGYSRVSQPQYFHEPGVHSFPGCSQWNQRDNSPDPLYNILHGDDIPDALKNTYTPTKGVQITSPNKKRVSPQIQSSGLRSTSSKGMRSGRIQDIPPFPPLTPYSNSKGTNHSNDGDGEEGSRSNR